MNFYKDKRVVLIYPNTRWFGKRAWMAVPYAVLIITALLKEWYDFHVIDANGKDLTEDDLHARLCELRPGVIMVSGGSVEYHRQAHLALSVARRACPAAITILGGVYATTLPEEAVKDDNLDWLFMHHAEERLTAFLPLVLSGKTEEARAFPGIAYRDAKGTLVENSVDSYIGSVKRMARPDYSLIDMRPYLKNTYQGLRYTSDVPTAFIISSYGCPHNCFFCASRTVSGRGTAFRPVADVVDEIDYLVVEQGVGHLIFMDDAFLGNQKRIRDILNTIVERRYALTWMPAGVAAWHISDDFLSLMKKSGCTHITISVESGSPRVLRDIIRKPLDLKVIPRVVRKCRDLDIHVAGNFIIGVPGETWDEILQTLRFAELCDFDMTTFTIATPLPRTDLYKVCREGKYLPDDFSFLHGRFFNFSEGFITTDEFTPQELSYIRTFEWDRINSGTPEKVERVARMYHMSVAALNEYRKTNRRKGGKHF